MLQLIEAVLIFLLIRGVWSITKGLFKRPPKPKSRSQSPQRFDLNGKDVSDADFEEI